MTFHTDTEKKNILLITYVFPPYPGIAGRRWAKFAKYLTRNGYRVHVICAKNPFHKKSLWVQDTENNADIVTHELPALYPAVLLTDPKTFFQKINYSFWNNFLPFITKGTIYDRALLWKKQLLGKAEDIIQKNNIQNVIVSGAPFNLNYFSTMLKNNHPSLNIISDLRDPWTWGHAYGYPSLSAQKKKYEKMKESVVMDRSDHITVPANVLKEHLASSYPLHAKKVVLLPHAFDSEEITFEKKTPSDKLRLIFYGSIYDHLEEHMREIAEICSRNQGRVQLDIYSDSNRHEELFRSYNLGDAVQYYPSVSSRDLFVKFKNYDYVLLMYPDYAINYLTTKIFEMLAAKTPVLYIGNKGATSDFVIENQLGVYISPADIKAGLQNLIDNKEMTDYNFNFDTKAFSFSEITQQLIKLFK